MATEQADDRLWLQVFVGRCQVLVGRITEDAPAATITAVADAIGDLPVAFRLPEELLVRGS
jgi:hypothetical protein